MLSTQKNNRRHNKNIKNTTTNKNMANNGITPQIGQLSLQFGQLSLKFDQLSLKFEQMIDGFSEIRRDITELKTDVSILKTDVTGLKKDVSGLKKDVSGLKKDVAVLKDDMSGVKKYMKLESNFQELRNREFISKIYQYNHPSNVVITIHVKKLFTKMGREITDCDGLLLISTLPLQINAPQYTIYQDSEWAKKAGPDVAKFSTTLQQTANKHFQQAERNMEYILIESKHSLWKGKIDLKIRQIDEIHTMLSTVTNDQQSVSTYKEMVYMLTTMTGLPPDKLDLPINFIYSSDDISQEVRNYIIAINSNTIMDNYDELVFQLFINDPFIDDIVKDICADVTIPKKIKSIIGPNRESMESIRNVFGVLYEKYCMDASHPDHKKREGNMKYFMGYVTPYSELKPFFDKVIGHLGISQFNTITFPRLFEKKSLNQM
jgi:FtsZ-binding cell division protein ZapB